MNKELVPQGKSSAQSVKFIQYLFFVTLPILLILPISMGSLILLCLLHYLWLLFLTPILRLWSTSVGKRRWKRNSYRLSREVAPVAKMTSIRTTLAIVASQFWPLFQFYVKNTFLHGDLKEVYMRHPPGYPTTSDDLVARLRHSLYGLKQAPRA